MSENISALIDKEIDEQHHEVLVVELCQNPELHQRWERYHLIRTAIRGECTRAYMNTVYGLEANSKPHVDQFEPDRKHSIVETLGAWLRSHLTNWSGGFGLAAGLSSAAVIGFFASSLIDVQFRQSETLFTETAYKQAGPVRWTSDESLADSDGQSVDFLNETLLAHSESTGYPMMNGLSNYVRLVAYER